MKLGSRVARLEQQARHANGVVVIVQQYGETVEQAKAKWRSDHPGKDPDDARVTVILVRWCPPQESNSSIEPEVSA
jgi:hypothetical protein